MLRNDQEKSFLFVCVVLVSLKCSFAGVSFEVTRRVQDIFKNPTVSTCGHLGHEFCQFRDSQCDWTGSQGCCYCACQYSKSTFETTSLKCGKNTDFRAGCKLLFKNVYSGQPIKLLDLARKGKDNVLWSGPTANEQVSSCQITSIVFLHNGAVVQTSFLKVGHLKNKKYNPLEIEIKWEKDVPKIYLGKVFKVNITCRTASGRPTACFVFKSPGKLTVTLRPLRSSSAVFLLKTSIKLEKSFITPSSSLVHVPESSFHIMRTISPTSTVPLQPAVVESTPVVSSLPILIKSTVLEPETGNTLVEPPLVTLQTTSFQANTRGTIEKEVEKPAVTISSSSSTIAESSEYIKSEAGEVSGGKSNNTVVISSSILGAVILLVLAILLLILRSRKKAAKSSGETENNRGVVNRGCKPNDNPVSMNYVENVYAEADHVVSARCGNDNSVYEYVDSNINENYTSLDKSICENIPHYQSLITVAAAPVPLIYSVLDNEPTQSANNYETLDQVTSPGPGHEQDEQLYSVLEEDKNETPSSLQPPESDYLFVLPENTEYEQPVDQPRS